MAPPKTTPAGNWQLRLTVWSVKSATILASRSIRWLVIGVCIGVAAYLAYGNVWQVIQTEAPLPAGVPPTNPSLNTQLLQDINQQRVDRVQQPPLEFNSNVIFLPDVTPR